MRWHILFVATTNAGKLRDFAAAAGAMGVRMEPLPGLAAMAEAVEDAETFLANAVKKAEHYSRLAPGLDVLADDSGLEVDALGGAPGVRSARFASDANFAGAPGDSNDARNNALLLERLRGVPEPRTARYRAALAVARDGVVTATAEGSVEGEILREPRGSGGFGYDPLFWLPELEMTMAEVDLATKQRLSHRGMALRRLLSD